MQNKENQESLVSKHVGTENVTMDTGLKDRIMSALKSDSSIDASNITIRMRENNMIELCGFVPRESMIILAEECVRGVEGVTGEIDNDLKVRVN